eukprot:5510548-Ditylum_brightwellii.AAC.1
MPPHERAPGNTKPTGEVKSRYGRHITWALEKCNLKHLKWESILIIVTDDLATAAYYNLKSQNKRDAFFPISYTKAHFYLNELPIVKDYREIIIDAWASQDFREHMKKIFKWKGDTTESVEWDIIGALYERKPCSKK